MCNCHKNKIRKKCVESLFMPRTAEQSRFLHGVGNDLILINSSTRRFTSETQTPKTEVLPPLGLALLLTRALQDGNYGSLLDMEWHQLSPKKTAKIINSSKPMLAGMNVLTPSHDIGVEVARALDPNILLVLGGPHATALPQRTVRTFSEVHPKTILLPGHSGQVESSFNLILSGVNPEDVPNVYRLDRGVVYYNTKIAEHTHFNDQPTIDRRFLPVAAYLDHRTGKREAAVVTSVHCPCNCRFCAGARGSTNLSTERRESWKVADEIAHLVNVLGAEGIRIVDDLFMEQFSKIPPLFDAIYKRSVALFPWRANGRVDIVEKMNDEQLNYLKSIFLRELALGIESGSNRILKLMNKRITVEQTLISVDRLIKAGIAVKGFFILGYPGETVEETRQTIALAKLLRSRYGEMFRASVFTYRAYPDAQDWSMLIAQEWTIDELLDMQANNTGDRGDIMVRTKAQFAQLPPIELELMITEFDEWQNAN